MIQSLLSLKNKRVKIVTRIMGTNIEKTYNGTLTSIFHDGEYIFVGLDTGELINTFYITEIRIEN